MAQSRLERIGTIFTRTSNLIKGGAMKPEDQPMWYIVYEAFPPKQEPKFDRPAPNLSVRNIFYKEDIVRSRFHNDFKKLLFSNLLDENIPTNSQKFIKLYQNLSKDEGSNSELFEKAVAEFNQGNLDCENKLSELVETSKSSITMKKVLEA